MKDFFPRAATALVLASTACLAFSLLSSTLFTLLLGFILLYILLVEWPRFSLWWFTPWYPIVPFLALMHLYLQDHMLWAWLVIVVAGYDTGGYIFGNLFGKHKIAPTVSAGKTWQGLVGGVMSAVVIGVLLSSFLLKNHNFSIITIISASFCVGILAFLGDLFESYLKRLAGLKDAGSILPGHGGILDRIDGLLFVALVFDVLLSVYMRVL